MGTVVVDLSVSLDGFIAGADDGPDRPLGRGGEALFAWMSAGPESNRVESRFAPPHASEIVVDEWMTEYGALITGRRTFDIANGWKHGHPIDVRNRLFDKLGTDPITLEQIRVIGSDGPFHETREMPDEPCDVKGWHVDRLRTHRKGASPHSGGWWSR